MRSSGYTDYVASILSGSAQPNASALKLTNVETVVPDGDVLKGYFELCFPLEKKKRLNDGENIILAEIRDGLLPKLISGKLSNHNFG